jgi:hypothetical protein
MMAASLKFPIPPVIYAFFLATLIIPETYSSLERPPAAFLLAP